MPTAATLHPAIASVFFRAAAHGHAQSNLAAAMAGTEPKSSHQPDEYIENKEYHNEPCAADIRGDSFGSIPLYLLVLIALYVEKIEWSDLQLRHHILIKTSCKIIRIRLRTYP